MGITEAGRGQKVKKYHSFPVPFLQKDTMLIAIKATGPEKQ